MTDKIINDEALDVIFRQARTRYAWQDRPVSDTMIQAIYDLMKWGPTSANSSPARFVFLKSKEAKERLRPHLIPSNIEKTITAPCTAIVAHDLAFYDELPKLFPHTDARSWFVGNEALIKTTAFRGGTLQGAYFIIAARALGLDCGPMSGFDNAGVDEAFFAGSRVKSNFLINFGFGTDENLFQRGPRLAFDEACRIA